MPYSGDVRVSFILSTRNRAEHLDRALSNLSEFAGPDDEVIVIDGGSTDHTGEVVRRHGDLVSLFHSEPDSGEAHGLNRGILRSRGRIIKQLTDDDYFFPDAMRRAIDVLEAHPEIEALVCGGEACARDPDGGAIGTVEYRYLPPERRLRDDVTHVLDYTQCGLGLVLTRRAVERVGLFDTTFRAVDTEYMTRLIVSSADVRYLNIKLFRHITYPHSGQHRESECARDRVRAMMRAGAWPALIDRHPISAIGDAFGLRSIPGGDALARLISYGERWRRSPLAPLMRLLAGGLHLASRATAPLRRVMRAAWSGGRASGSTPPDLTVEPEWDGELR